MQMHGVENSVYPDKTAPLGAVRSGSALFIQTCLSQYIQNYCFNKRSNRYLSSLPDIKEESFNAT